MSQKSHLQYSLLSALLLIASNVHSAMTTMEPVDPSFEHVITIDFVKVTERRCTPEIGPSTPVDSTFQENALYGILLAAEESDIEVSTIDNDHCLQDFSAL
jgi:hypothetical protein